MDTAASANSAPRSIRPWQRARAWALFSATMIPLITGTRDESATPWRPFAAAEAISS